MSSCYFSPFKCFNRKWLQKKSRTWSVDAYTHIQPEIKPPRVEESAQTCRPGPKINFHGFPDLVFLPLTKGKLPLGWSLNLRMMPGYYMIWCVQYTSVHTSYLSNFYTISFWGLKISHWKVRKFAKKLARDKKAWINILCKITHCVCKISHCVSRNTKPCVKLHTVYRFTHCV